MKHLKKTPKKVAIFFQNTLAQPKKSLIFALAITK
jgi:hypothetical protein